MVNRKMNDNYFASVGAIVLRGNEVLLVRHTYGSASGKLLNPGGYIHDGELPYEAVKREVFEETGITCDPVGMLALRCQASGWYLVFLCEYKDGEPKSDESENSEALFMDCNEALLNPTLTDTAKGLIDIALNKEPLPMKDAKKGRVIFEV
jgi:8-oxo-dGTP pyrophosphatase MutT (NUDIX family)